MLDPVTMELRQVAGCKDTECPKVFVTDRGTAVFQGDIMAGLRPGPGEQAVELPLNVVRDALSALLEDSA
jgi:hypothetical protein